jgi:hypothetical protein
MKKALIRLTDFTYYKLTGTRVWNLKTSYDELLGSLQALSEIAVKNPDVPKKVNWTELFPENKIDNDTKDLGELFKKYGSDKSTRHNYYQVYGELLKNKRNSDIKIFEFGLGIPSESVHEYCASSKAFRDWAPKAHIYGADFNKAILFQEDRIKTFYVDQTKPETLKELVSQISEKFDLIIDDGLHSPWSNFNTINFALPLLKESGVLVVEDILKRHEYFWPIFMATLSSGYSCQFVQMKYQSICIIKRKS